MNNIFGSTNSAADELEATKIQISATQDNYNKIIESCFKKCVVKYSDSDLAVGEMTCVDRCAWKYMEAQYKMNDVVHRFEQQLLQQQMATAQLNSALMGKK